MQSADTPHSEIYGYLDALGLSAPFRQYLEASPGLAFLRDAEGKTLYLNPAYEQAFRITLREAFGKPARTWLPARQAEQQEAQDAEVIATGRPLVATISDQGSDQLIRLWRIYRFPLTAPNGMRMVAGWAIDVTNDLVAAERLSAAEQKVDRLRVFADALDGIAQINAEGTIEYVNRRLASLLGTQVADLVGRKLTELVLPEDAAVFEAAIRRLSESNRAETECRFPAGGRVMTAWIKLIREEGSKQTFLFVHDTSLQREFQEQLEESMRLLHETQIQLAARQQELEEANRKLHVLATTDGLTGLLNHRKFQEELADAVAFSERYEQPFSMLLLDIDHFKQYNDVFGHPAGDDALRRFAQILMEEARSTDTVARYGGEEFATILRMTDAQGAREIAERIRASIEQAEWPLRQVTASIGIATFGTSGKTPAELIEAADKALYRSKIEGRNRATHADDTV